MSPKTCISSLSYRILALYVQILQDFFFLKIKYYVVKAQQQTYMITINNDLW